MSDVLSVPQTFTPGDLLALVLIVGLEAVLSADNAIVLSIMVRGLEPRQQRRALSYGLLGAFVFRAIAIAGASYLLGAWWLQAIGACYLLYLPLRYFSADVLRVPKQPQVGLWGTVLRIELTDLVFSVDSILAGLAMVAAPSKLWIVYVGGIASMVLLRLATMGFAEVVSRRPEFEETAYVMVAWAGFKLLISALSIFGGAFPKALPWQFEPISDGEFWFGSLIIVGLSLGRLKLRKSRSADDKPAS